MPYREGIGLAWNYIERVVNDLSCRTVRDGGVAFIAHPELASATHARSDTVARVRRMFYGVGLRAAFENAKWLRQVGATHVYFAEHQAFDWRFAIYHVVAGVRITVHYHHGGGRAEPYTGFARLLRTVRQAIGVMAADQVICVSQFICERVVNVAMVPSARAVAVLNAVVPESEMSDSERRSTRAAVRSELGVDDTTVVILCGARAAREKGIDILFQAFDALCQSLTAAATTPLPVLIYAGDGPDFEAFRDLQRSLAHGERIQMLGRRPSMRPLLAAADIAVLPSVYDEAFGLFAIEAMQQHLPVIVTDRGGLPESVSDGVDGFVVRPSDPAMLAHRLELLVTDPARRAAMGERGAVSTRTRNAYDTMLEQLERYIGGQGR